jgi:TetR/AcrR family transcriptional repressor of nem operon
MKKQSKTGLKILYAAQQLVQRVGFNGFSYADLSAILGIRKASIHYHFPAKADLIIALVQMYKEEFLSQLASLDQEERHCFKRLERFIGLYRGTLEDDSKLCLCSILSAEVETLPEGVREEINLFFNDIEQWLANLFQQGIESKDLMTKSTPLAEAKLLLAVMKGAQLLARSYQCVDNFDLIVRNMSRYYKNEK